MKSAHSGARESVFVSTATEVATGVAVFMAPAVAVVRAVAGTLGHTSSRKTKPRRASVVYSRTGKDMHAG
jgi:hypothetical protein